MKNKEWTRTSKKALVKKHFKEKAGDILKQTWLDDKYNHATDSPKSSNEPSQIPTIPVSEGGSQ